MASGDTREQNYLDIAAHGSRADLPTETCCETRTQTLTRQVAERIITEEETRAREDAKLQNEIDEIKNSPDVVDIVATYAALQSYDTSHLNNNDVIRVLQDETHEGQSAYYRFTKNPDTWTFIGTVGDYYTKTQLDAILETKQDELTAGDNISIEDESGALVISATDTTYSNFTGTDGTAAGAAGLVPAPATTDAGKFLKADGTWDDAGSVINVVQTTGTSTTDVMSQNAVTSMVFADPSTLYKVQIGSSAEANGADSVAIGRNAKAQGLYSVALGANAKTTVQGQFDIGCSSSSYGYNSSEYRLLTGLYDGQSAHDAATYGQVVSYSAINGAGAPTTATEGKYVGQLYYDTTNEAMYFLKTIDTTTDPAAYTWEALGGGGGGGSSITELTATDYNYPTNNPYQVALWLLPPGVYSAKSGVDVAETTASHDSDGGLYTVSGLSSTTYLITQVHLKWADNNNTFVKYHIVDDSGQWQWSLNTYPVYDALNSTSGIAPLSANQGRVLNNKITPATGSGAPTTSTSGDVGKIYIDTDSDTAYMCVNKSGSTYTWKQITT